MNKTGKSQKKKNRGSSMAEVLVGFTLLAILMAGVSKLVSVSVNMFFETNAIRQEQMEFQEKYFKKEMSGLNRQTTVAAGKLSLVQTNSDGQEKTGGSVIMLPQMQMEKLTDSQTKIFVYRFSHK